MTEPGAVVVEASEDELPWLRLDKRMLLVHPVNEAVKVLPVLLISLFVGTQNGNHLWSFAIVGALVVFALLRWFTTTYRVGPVHIQLRKGIFQKSVLSIPRNRIRSVDVEANVLHRVLGLSVVRIGTGQQKNKKGEAFELNALATDMVPALRENLLHRSHAAGVSVTKIEADVEIAHWSAAWVRYAPFSLTGIVAIGAVIGVLFNYGGRDVAQSGVVSGGVRSAERVGIATTILVAILVLIVAASVLACIRYLFAYGGFRVIDDGEVLHVEHGLLRTRQTTLDRTRMRGATLKEPLLLRLAGGAKLEAVMTGVRAERRESSLLLPQAPAADAHRVMMAVLEDRAVAPELPLRMHGPIARRRRYVRALTPVVVLAVVYGLVERLVDRPSQYWTAGWIAFLAILCLAVGLAWDRYRSLGHAAPPGWLITRSGSLDRQRDSIESAGIIGWTVRQTFFQRRAGVATVIAATPAGAGRYDVRDLPENQAWDLVDAVTPGGGDVWQQTPLRRSI